MFCVLHFKAFKDKTPLIYQNFHVNLDAQWSKPTPSSGLGFKAFKSPALPLPLFAQSPFWLL